MQMQKQLVRLASAAVALLAVTRIANAATREECCHVVQLTATPMGVENAWNFAATLSSPYEAQTGWDKYCDAFEIRGADDEEGTVFATRILGHPHPEEQPFTRSTTAMLPPGVQAVTAVARDSVEGYCGDGLYMEMDGASQIVATRAPAEAATVSPMESPSGSPTATASAPLGSSSSGEDTKAPINTSLETPSPPTAAATITNAASTAWAFAVATLLVTVYRLG